ncbi:MAG: chromosome segregation protein SMC [Pirellulales bacterium]|nr:chromosome segregation protein SMC [Pirellulales bacterium]
MLKALDIVGFKSFADRTRFEFPPGITVVVGPNGSGKSNIVDAIKWVLGEQSVKSLRGREMADVIFNGSGSRKAINAAEITLTLDNSKRVLAVDAAEVHITRRVYRGGEGEYLINRNPARLRDIRDLLSGTGMGTQAYSVIEQGKVDALLQSSPRDRRLIFEEAAGISRFKARKIEALRRLERVEQNLLRLGDIVDEVENRLRGVRAQAGKARRYREYTNRLQELRTQVAQVEWKRLGDRLATFERELRSLGDARDAAAATAENMETQLLEIDDLSAEVNEEIHRAEAKAAANREKIAAAESTIEHQRSYGLDLEGEIARARKQLAAMSARAGDVQQQLRENDEALQAAERNHRQVAKRLVEGERELTDAIDALDRLRGENQQRRAAYLEQMRLSAALGNEIGVLESRAAAAETVRQRCGRKIEELDPLLDDLQRQLEAFRSRRDELLRQETAQSESLAAAKKRLAELTARRPRLEKELAELRRRQSAAAERAAVLEELVLKNEGLSEGVKEILDRVAKADDGVFRHVRGLLADLLTVGVEIAPLVEIALEQKAHHVVAKRTRELLDFLWTESNRIGGRVGFLWLDRNCATDGRGLAGSANLEGQPGVIGRADKFVESAPDLTPLVERLLGRTWFVKKLEHAFELAASDGAGSTFVTSAGELLEADGTLVIGPRKESTGLISRRSQLRALGVQLNELETAVAAAQKESDELDEQIAAEQRAFDNQLSERQRTAAALAEIGTSIAAAEERRSQLDRQRTALRDELRDACEQYEAVAARLGQAQEKRRQTDAALAEMESSVERTGREIERLEARRQTADRETTEIKVELAKSEERLRNLRSRMRQFEDNRQERQRAIEEAQRRLDEGIKRCEASRRDILRAEAEIAELYLRKETFAAETVALVQRRDELQNRRSELSPEIQKARGRVRKLEEKAHAAELSAAEVRQERLALAARLREDYGIELAELEHDFSDEEQRERETVQQEIEELRQKIGNLGNVNLEALEELDQLEARHKTLADQHHDLTSARSSLERIIEKINGDSRRLFTETLETVRGHFQTLFRDLFGGGRADIVMEEDADILESGIEIVARPPGKEPRSISLLSGGEKTLTCVALLLAIFRSRPSPFCVLDEVDAALDEANIERFTQVLKDFLAWTQFIIVTHSKKTMTCANTIYGVTMQESGVTKQVSVRFEDVSEDGEILADRQSEDGDTQAA